MQMRQHTEPGVDEEKKSADLGDLGDLARKPPEAKG
jgi:hypothetical protein